MDWQFWIDVGGTFTDCLGVEPGGPTHRLKVLSSSQFPGRVEAIEDGRTILDAARCCDPHDFWNGYAIRFPAWEDRPAGSARVLGHDAEAGRLTLDRPCGGSLSAGQPYRLQSDEPAPLLAIRYLLRRGRREPLPPVKVRLGTTKGTNTLLTRSGARTALVINEGLADLPWIGDQTRPELFQLHIVRPEPICEAVVEVSARVAADGTVLASVNEAEVLDQLAALRSRGLQSVAVCLMHGHAYPEHEQAIARLARRLGFDEIVCSHQVARTIKIVPRCDTTMAEAYLNPVLRRYVQEIEQTLGAGSELRLMGSAGGLLTARDFSGKDSLFSGPAGGVVGCQQVARQAGLRRALGFDMGGTSTDVSRSDDDLDLVFEVRKNGLRVVAPMLAIETIAAGGGSLCRFDGVKLTVGPESAGADPGPACYGQGGPLTVTDMNLILGRILPEHFPLPLDVAAAEQQLEVLRGQIAASFGVHYSLPELAAGFVTIANAHMARAMETVTLHRGVHPRDYGLVAFGGAAPQHACGVARLLGIRHVAVHRDAGLLSALGIGWADVAHHAEHGIDSELNPESLARAHQVLDGLADEVRHRTLRDGVPADRIRIVRTLELRFRGQDATLAVEEPSTLDDVRAAFERAYRSRHGYLQQGRALELVLARARSQGRASPRHPFAAEYPQPPCRGFQKGETHDGGKQFATTYFGADPVQVPVYRWHDLRQAANGHGPAIVVTEHATVLVEPGWQARRAGEDMLVLEDEAGASRLTVSQDADPIQLEVFHHAFMGIAEHMGIALQQSARSVNVKERLDFSCALFTPQGDLVANAPHVPVHLGAMSETLRSMLRHHPDIQDGDVLITNDPYHGGSHLPDVTVASPIVDPGTGELLAWTASRAHHAEIGGTRPGSMPPFSRCLAEEGVLIRCQHAIVRGQSRLDQIEALLHAGPYPSRAVSDNLADIMAQIAANRRGCDNFMSLVQRVGWETVRAYLGHILDAAEVKTAAALKRLPPSSEFSDHLDDGSRIQLRILQEGGIVTLDFRGSAPVHPGNLNANRAIVRAATIYCLRCLIDEPIPLNDGVLRPVRWIIPEGLLDPPDRHDPQQCAAVVGGNVETSQRLVDVILGALRVAAASQGTMNNVLFGDQHFGYYETICGGAGATPQGAGANSVHTHMTNTRMTDPEILEQRYPVRLIAFRRRRGSGGIGQFSGGDGTVRRIEFLRPLQLSILSQRRGTYPPFGMHGGEAGAIGRNTLHRADGTVELLGGCVETQVDAGDILTIETPGGGGWGKQEQARGEPSHEA